MGTRHLTSVVNEQGLEIFVMYGQWDGYATGHGKNLKEFLQDYKIVNGIGEIERPMANGMACLAAQLVAHFKTIEKYPEGHTPDKYELERGVPGDFVVGSYYLEPAGTRDCGEEYIYTISAADVPDHLNSVSVNLKVEKVYGGLKTLYEGPVVDFDPVAIEALLNQE